MTRIKVLQVIRPAAGGMKTHLKLLARYLDSSIFEIMVACPVDDELHEELKDLGILTVPIPLKGEFSPFEDLLTIRILINTLKKQKVTILHSHGFKASLVARLAAIIAKTPIVFITVHNSIFYDDWPGWKKKLSAFLDQALCRCTDRIITVSNYLQKELMFWERIKEEQLVTIYNGIEEFVFQQDYDKEKIRQSLGLPLSENVVGAIARLAPQKGIIYLLKAASLLAVDFPVSFLIVGDGPLRADLEAERDKLGLQGRVIFSGYRYDVPEILKAIDLFILPSVTEGLPLVLLEAMASGLPVVATSTGGIPEVIKDNENGLLVKTKDAAALAGAITDLLVDRDKALKFGRLGQARVKEQFSAKAMMEKTQALYLEVLRSKGF